MMIIMLIGVVVVACGKEDVEITLPASMFKDQDADTIISEAKKDGVEDVVSNSDGSFTYKMSKAKHKEMLEEMKTSILGTIEETKTSEEFASIEEITSNKDFTEFTMVVEKGKFESSFDGFAAMGLGISGIYYQTFNGVKEDKVKATIIVKDKESGETIDTIVYPDDLNQQNK
ncbi:hypothetical protein CSE16_11925 [Solibacillus sp. R5-41]|nr:hypothetical protein CSE16_11925 [Solibacillus sp. R5-41]